MAIKLTTVLIAGGVGFVGYQLYKTSQNINRTAQNLNPLLNNLNGIAGSVNKFGADFSSVSNAAANIAKGLGNIFAVSGSGASSTLARAPSSSTAPGGVLAGALEPDSSFDGVGDWFGGPVGPGNGAISTGLFGDSSSDTTGLFSGSGILGGF